MSSSATPVKWLESSSIVIVARAAVGIVDQRLAALDPLEHDEMVHVPVQDRRHGELGEVVERRASPRVWRGRSGRRWPSATSARRRASTARSGGAASRGRCRARDSRPPWRGRRGRIRRPRSGGRAGPARATTGRDRASRSSPSRREQRLEQPVQQALPLGDDARGQRHAGEQGLAAAEGVHEGLVQLGGDQIDGDGAAAFRRRRAAIATDDISTIRALTVPKL